jgi:tRNA (guanosine-2'-O-)-methyltransferase
MDIDPSRHAALEAYLCGFLTPARLAAIERVLAQRTRFVTVVLDDLGHAANANAVLRSCECMGVQDVHLIGARGRFRLVRGVSAGAAKWLTLRRYSEPGVDNTAVCLNGLREAGYRIVATALTPGAVPVEELPLDRPIALCLGNEDRGISDTTRRLAETTVRLAMSGFTQSFNVSVATALCLHGIVARLRRGEAAWQLSGADHENLRFDWVCKSVRHRRQLVERFLAESAPFSDRQS